MEGLHIHNLPDEMIMRIFQFFDIIEQDFQLARVCQKWKMLTKIVSFRITVDVRNLKKYFKRIKPWNLTKLYQGLQDSLIRSPSLKACVYENLDGVPHRMLYNNFFDTLMNYNKKVTYLSVENRHTTDLNPSISDVTERLVMLENFVLSIPRRIDLNLAVLKELRTLEFYMWKYSDFNIRMETASEVGINPSTLQKLIIHGNQKFRGDDRYKGVTSRLISAFATSLIELHIPFHLVDEENLNKVYGCKELQKLHLSCGSLTNIEIPECILENLKVMKSLKPEVTWDLANVMENSLLKLFLSRFWNCQKSIYLFHRMDLTDAHLHELAGNKNSNRIESICIEDCPKLTDIGIRYLVERCKSLHSLSVIECLRIEGEFLRSIREYLPQLKNVCLDGCEVRSKDCREELYYFHASSPSFVPVKKNY